MLKQISAGLFTLAFAVTNFSNLSGTPAQATTNQPLVIDNVLDLCQNILSHGYSFNPTNDCTIYSKTQTSATIDRALYISDNLTLQNLNLTFTKPNAVFFMRDGAQLIIDGGHYTSPNCIVWIQYNNRTTPATYVPDTTFTINSGVFEATVETANSAAAPSPVCLLSFNPVTPTDAETIIANYLPAGRRFVNVTTNLRSASDPIAVATGSTFINKDPDEATPVSYLQTTIVSVIADDGQGGTEPEEPEEPTEPEQPENPTEPETSTPKAPNTGRH